MAATGHLGQLGKEAAAIIGQSVVAVTADLTAVNRWNMLREFQMSREFQRGDSQNTFILLRSLDGPMRVPDGTVMADLVKDLLVQPVHDLSEKEKKFIKLAVDSLVKEKNQREFFNSFIPNGKNIVFAVTIATIKDGVLTARAAAFECEATEEITDCLLFKINKTNINIKIRQYHVNFSVDQGVFDANRKMVEEKLQASPGKYVEEIPLN
ncbi:hypothetical protein BD779DRAFT_1476750 [Infundibulicybe gibba]|nr:hypothetical protein BD779DRAFT_1476750 [Infundibulicybe gibba]